MGGNRGGIEEGAAFDFFSSGLERFVDDELFFFLAMMQGVSTIIMLAVY
jgi:hypothetical protein